MIRLSWWIRATWWIRWTGIPLINRVTRINHVNPDAESGNAAAVAKAQAAAVQKIDAKGRAYQVLPRVNPVDCYYLHNPDGYYRME